LSNLLRVTIEKLVQGGRGFARTANGVLFIEGALPGEVVLCRPFSGKSRKGYSEAETVEVVTPSPLRAQPICPYYGICGGCNLQHLSAEAQPEMKRTILLENLRRIGGLGDAGEVTITAGVSEQYRVRARFQLTDSDPDPDPDPEPSRKPRNGGNTDRKQLKAGFFQRGSHSVVPIQRCPLLIPELNALLEDPALREWAAGIAQKDSLSKQQKGVYAAANPAGYALGKEEITLQILDKNFLTQPRLFFQSNPALFGTLVKDFLGGLQGDHAVDLYSGVGTLASFLADNFTRITAVEQNPDCRYYAEQNLPAHAKVFSKSVEAWVRTAEKQPIDLLAVDPPRTGLSKETVTAILKIRPAKILYISCDSITFSRDLNILTGIGSGSGPGPGPGSGPEVDTSRTRYEIQRIGAYDLYPHTSHLETAALLVREKPGLQS
jgi:23S rRNA (uracil1939-C5)-methyltransferase